MIGLPGLAHPQAPDDPFYDWDLEGYRIARAPDDPSPGLLPLPDLHDLPPGFYKGSATLRLEGADVETPVAAEEEDGRRHQDGTRLLFDLEERIDLYRSIRVALGGRFLLGDGRQSGGAWLERNLSWRSRSTEITLGMTRAFLGDGSEGSLLLGRTAPPLEMIRLRSIRPWRIPYAGEAGRIHGLFFLAYLDDRFRTIPYPLLHGMRVEWEPTSWIRIFGARTILFGGAGRTEKLTPGDLWDIWLGRNENIVGERPVSDSDQKASFGLELRLPRERSPFSWFEGARIFYEYAGEDSFERFLPTAVAHHRGGAVSALGWTLLLETTETVDDANYWYVRHNVYGENAYYFRGYVLGHPMSGDGRSGHLRIWTPAWRQNRAQFWIRSRGHHDRETEKTLWWDDSGGVRIRRDLLPTLILDASVELSRSHGDLSDLPDPPVRWRWTIALSTGRLGKTSPDDGDAGPR